MIDYSQSGEQDILFSIFKQIPKSRLLGVAVDIGAKDGTMLSNIKALAESYGWRKVQFDIQPSGPDIIQADVTPDSVNDLFFDNGISKAVDLLSIDIDGNDYWVWESISCIPTVVILEYNQNLHPESCLAMKYDSKHIHDGTEYYGASFGAMKKLSSEKGYILIAVTPINSIFIRSDFFKYIHKEYNLIPFHGQTWAPDTLNRSWVKV